MRFRQLVVAILCLPATARAAANATAAGPTATLPNGGTIEGVDLGPDGHPTLAEFRGIPYALPPTGPRRWMPPEAHPGWADGTAAKATEFGNNCVQISLPPQYSSLRSDATLGEDCLFLNIVAPKSALEDGGAMLPVMVWFHGGRFMVGSSDEIGNRRAALVSSSDDGIIVVSVNYRLGILGFLASSEIMDRTNGNGAGNFGIQDQRLALTWIKDKIGAFGGDGGDITIFGQSAGGSSIFNHLVQPASFPLYQKAIIQTGTMKLGSTKMAEAEEFYEDVLVTSGCADLACLVAADADALIENEPSNGWFPVIDGVSLADTPSALIAAKHYNNEVPVIIGSTRDEVFQWIDTNPDQETPHNLTEEEFDTFNTTFLPGLNDPYSEMEPAKLAELKRVYDPENYTYPANLGEYSIWYWMNGRYHVDMPRSFGACNVRWIARLLHEGGTPAVYSFLFAFAKGSNLGGNGLFAVHGDDTLFCFDGLDELANILGTDPDSISTQERNFAKTMAAYWYSFAISKDGDPNPNGEVAGGAVTTWPEFTTEGDTVLILDVESNGGFRAQAGLRKAACDWQMEQDLEQGILVNADGATGPIAEGAPSTVAVVSMRH